MIGRIKTLRANPEFQAKDGTDISKCLQLITAAAQGNLEEVVRLSSDPAVDVNYLAVMNAEYYGTEYQSALCAAVINNRSDIVAHLLNVCEAKVQLERPDHFVNNPFYASLMALVCIDTTEAYCCDLTIFKHLLRVTSNPHLLIVTSEKRTLIARLQDSMSKTPNITERINLFFHELVLRNARKCIDESKDFESLKINIGTFSEYISDRKFTAVQAEAAHLGLDYLVVNLVLSEEDCKLMKEMIAEKAGLKLERDEFPAPLHALSTQEKLILTQSADIRQLREKVESLEKKVDQMLALLEKKLEPEVMAGVEKGKVGFFKS